MATGPEMTWEAQRISRLEADILERDARIRALESRLAGCENPPTPEVCGLCAELVVKS